MTKALVVIGLFHLVLWAGLAVLTVLEPPRRPTAPLARLDHKRASTSAPEVPVRRAA